MERVLFLLLHFPTLFHFLKIEIDQEKEPVNYFHQREPASVWNSKPQINFMQTFAATIA